MNLSTLLPDAGPGQSFKQMVPEPQSAGLLHPLWSTKPQAQGMPMQVSPVERGTSMLMSQPVALQPNPTFVRVGMGPDAYGEASGTKKTRKRKKATMGDVSAKEPARGRNKRQKNTQLEAVATTVALPGEELQGPDRSQHATNISESPVEAALGRGPQGPHTVAVCGVGPLVVTL